MEILNAPGKEAEKRRRQWRGLTDTLYDYFAWLANISLLTAAAVRMRANGRQFAQMLEMTAFVDTMTAEHRHYELRIAHTQMHAIVKHFSRQLSAPGAIKTSQKQNERRKKKREALLREKTALFKCGNFPLAGTELYYEQYERRNEEETGGIFIRADRKVLRLMAEAYLREYMPFNGKMRHRALLCGAVSDRYPAFATWLINCWGIAAVAETDVDEMCAAAEAFNCDTVLYAEKGVPFEEAQKKLQSLGVNVILLETDSRKSMRECVERYMMLILGERPFEKEGL